MAYDLQYLSDVHELREIITRAALALDTRQFDNWLDLCMPDVVLIFPLDPANPTICKGRDAFREQLGVLHAYEATTHFTGNMVTDIHGDEASTETYCIAHHLQKTDEGRTDLRMSVRYRDSFVRVDGAWRMSKREMVLVWSDLTPAPEA